MRSWVVAHHIQHSGDHFTNELFAFAKLRVIYCFWVPLRYVENVLATSPALDFCSHFLVEIPSWHTYSSRQSCWNILPGVYYFNRFLSRISNSIPSIFVRKISLSTTYFSFHSHRSLALWFVYSQRVKILLYQSSTWIIIIIVQLVELIIFRMLILSKSDSLVCWFCWNDCFEMMLLWKYRGIQHISGNSLFLLLREMGFVFLEKNVQLNCTWAVVEERNTIAALTIREYIFLNLSAIYIFIAISYRLARTRSVF